MTADIVNLRRVRKAKARQAEAARADENRAKHGRTKAEREIESARRALEDRKLDSTLRERDSDEPCR